MLRKIFLFLLIIIFALIVSAVFLFQSPSFWEKAFLKVLNGRWSGVSFKEIAIDDVQWSGLNQVEFKNVLIKVKVDDASYFISTGKVDIKGFHSFVSPKPVLNIDLASGAIISDVLNGSNISLNIQVDFEHFHATPSRVYMSKIDGEFYKGRIYGEAGINFRPKNGYTISLKLNHIDLEELAQSNPNAFEHMKGTGEGEFNVKGNDNYIRDLNVRFNVPNGHVSANILRVLAEVVPKGNIIRQPLDEVIRTKLSIPFDVASFSFERSGRGQYKANVNIYSPAAFIDLRYKYDIHIEGGLMLLLKSMRFSKS